MENSTANHYMDDQENFGLCDNTLEIFQEFMAMAIVTAMYPRIDLECSICMNILARPHQLEDCFHVFCDRLWLSSAQKHLLSSTCSSRQPCDVSGAPAAVRSFSAAPIFDVSSHPPCVCARLQARSHCRRAQRRGGGLPAKPQRSHEQ